VREAVNSVPEPRLKQVLVYEDSAAGSPEMVGEAHKTRVVVMLGTKTKKHSDGAIGSHDIVKGDLYERPRIIGVQCDSGTFEHLKLGVESNRTKLLYVRVHEFFQIFIYPFKK
jgi:hypothetical protein